MHIREEFVLVVGWLVWAKRPFETVFSLYRAVFQREGEEERKDRGE